MKSSAPLLVILFTTASNSTLLDKTTCPSDKKLLKITLTTDDNPSQISWTLRNDKDELIAASQPHKYEGLTVYEHNACLNHGEFKVVVRDSGKDGLCCDNGEGGYVISVDGEVIREINGEYAFEKDEFQFEVVESTTTMMRRSTTAQHVIEQSNESVDSEDWTNFDYTHTKFCGPKIVGGYEEAVAQCGPSRKCGLESKQGQYGSSGNDCPKGLMCYADIPCTNGPGESAVAVSLIEDFVYSEMSSSSQATTESMASTSSGNSNMSEMNNAMTMTSRGSYCGLSYEEALDACSPETHCSFDENCLVGKCFPDISCNYSGKDIASLEKDGQKEGLVVSNMMEDVTSFALRKEVHFQLLIMCLAGFGAFLI